MSRTARDVVFVDGVRTPFGKSGKGLYAETRADDLIVRVIREEAREVGDTPPLLGTYRRDSGVLRFEPRFPIEPGVRYRAEFDPHGRLTVSGSATAPATPAERKPASRSMKSSANSKAARSSPP